jgi:NAD(P)-dependent dehydrogenase (short-subunit alcohol dehydrogenase family)
MKRLSGKVALITGAGQGLGLGIAEAFADEGALLALTGRREAVLKSAAESLAGRGAKVITIVADSRRREDARKAIDATVKAFGRLDILVNNAQSSTPGKPFSELDDDTIDLTIESGLYGTIYHMQEAFPHLKVHGGSIINLGSREGIFGGLNMSIYAATKEGIRGLSRSAAREWGRDGVRVNVLCPAALSPVAANYLDSHPDEAKMYLAQTSLGYFGNSLKDIGPVAVFLASAEARYVTGQTINADGGQMML